MKSTLTILIAAVFVQMSFSQNIELGKRVIYAELMGNALAYSINFEQGLNVRDQNFGIRIGAGYIPSSGESALTMPLHLNYLLGSKHALEIGIGATLQIRGNNESEIRPSSALMYRYCSCKGFIFRVGIAPTWLPKSNEAMHIPAELFWFYPGISFGLRL